jgi:hypothetical protein
MTRLGSEPDLNLRSACTPRSPAETSPAPRTPKRGTTSARRHKARISPSLSRRRCNDRQCISARVPEWGSSRGVNSVPRSSESIMDNGGIHQLSPSGRGFGCDGQQRIIEGLIDHHANQSPGGGAAPLAGAPATAPRSDSSKASSRCMHMQERDLKTAEKCRLRCTQIIVHCLPLNTLQHSMISHTPSFTGHISNSGSK